MVAAVRAFVLTGPREYAVHDVPPPVAQPGEVVVDVERAGVCGTDVEFFTGQMQYLHDGFAHYPLRIGHEWCGVVASIGDGVDPKWLGKRVTGDTMLGCGTCHRCTTGFQHVCETRFEIGIRGGFAGALAEQLAVPARALHSLPDQVDPELGALVEPGGNALRSVLATGLEPGSSLLIIGPGTIGLIAAQIARAHGLEVHLLGRSARSLDYARRLGFESVHTATSLPNLRFDGAIDASDDPASTGLAIELVEPGRRISLIGIAGSPSMVDARLLVLKDVTAVGILSASPGLAGTIDLYASGTVDPRPLIAATVGLDEVGSVLSSVRPDGAGAGPKILVDPRA
ncbi:zinc-binding dehydrogenase [Homoserinimonas sp. OAct 916]|uniref:zinc-dependent alcohol dehydrogenase n=1 Tax=Homoserinimonas sp. OAct 916 TaxID=2211450 RepID=UPI000DBE2301|nr:alcohol dehydrogenase catalytic domain-containing protein [Homoserinimonas sp. OAct 916]